MYLKTTTRNNKENRKCNNTGDPKRQMLFYVHVTVHRNKFIYNKTNRRNDFPNLFWLKNEPLHVSGSSSADHQEFVNCTLGTDICHTV